MTPDISYKSKKFHCKFACFITLCGIISLLHPEKIPKHKIFKNFKFVWECQKMKSFLWIISWGSSGLYSICNPTLKLVLFFSLQFLSKCWVFLPEDFVSQAPSLLYRKWVVSQFLFSWHSAVSCNFCNNLYFYTACSI